VNNISIRKMRILLATAEEGNFTRAAIRENISQPAATIIINEIEETIGQELFLRQGTFRRAVLSEMGRTVAETFSRIVASYDTELSRIRALNTGKRRVKRILIQNVFVDAIDPNWLFALADLLVGERLVIEEASRDQIVDKINARNSDIGLLDGLVDTQLCDSSNIGTVRIGLAIPESFVASNNINAPMGWDDVPDGCYVLAGFSEAVSRAINRNLAEVGKSVSDMNIINGMSALRAAAMARPLPILLPDVLMSALGSAVPYHFQVLSPALIDTPFAIITPWGYMNQINIKFLRGLDCFKKGKRV
jgi:DNA-binding transcriptional LysR family regulator